ncbi:MAG: DUF4214 domain-containing protein [Pseudomonadota bacterium]|nr:DUF4214 domain-containing protein [Pseudomonadota bacterium]
MPLFPHTHLRARCATLLVALALSGCGAGDTAGTASQPDRLLSAGTTAVAADYLQPVQQIYVAYFGRPADAGGLASFEAQLAAAGAPNDIQKLTGAYNANPAIRALVDSFAVSDESKALYAGDTRAFVTAIYTNVLNRAPDVAGLNYWIDAIDHQGLNRANASLAIMAGALLNTTTQGQADAHVVSNKITIANSFTTTVPSSTYRGNTAAALARAMLTLIDQNTTLATFQGTITSTIKAIADALPSIYAGNYNGSYDGSDSGAFTFTVSNTGVISGTGKSSVYDTLLIITGTLGTSSASPLPLQGTIGQFGFTGTIDATGKMLGQYTGSGVFGHIVAQRATP